MVGAIIFAVVWIALTVSAYLIGLKLGG